MKIVSHLANDDNRYYSILVQMVLVIIFTTIMECFVRRFMFSILIFPVVVGWIFNNNIIYRITMMALLFAMMVFVGATLDG